MALIACPECKKEISDQSESCPHCGYPIARKKPGPSFSLNLLKTKYFSRKSLFRACLCAGVTGLVSFAVFPRALRFVLGISDPFEAKKEYSGWYWEYDGSHNWLRDDECIELGKSLAPYEPFDEVISAKPQERSPRYGIRCGGVFYLGKSYKRTSGYERFTVAMCNTPLKALSSSNKQGVAKWLSEAWAPNFYCPQRRAPSLHRPYMGVRMQELTPEAINLAKPVCNLKANKGVIVVEVIPDSPAEAAGIMKCDVIQKIDDRSVIDPEQAQSIIKEFRDGRDRSVVVQRGEDLTSLTFTPADMPGNIR